MDVLCWAARCCPAVEEMRRCRWSPPSWSTWAARSASCCCTQISGWALPGADQVWVCWPCSGGFRAPWTTGFPLCAAREGEISPSLVCRVKRDAPAACGTPVMGANQWVRHPKYDRNRCCGIYHGYVNCNNRVERNPAPRGEGRESELEETPCLPGLWQEDTQFIFWCGAQLR